MKQSFLDCFQALRDCPVDLPKFVPLIQEALLFKEPKELDKSYGISTGRREEAEWSSLQQHLEALSERYAEEQGENAYAVLNAITELASHPPDNRQVRRDKHSFQRLAGEWLIAFSQQCRQSPFSIDHYLAELAMDKSPPSSTDVRSPHVRA